MTTIRAFAVIAAMITFLAGPAAFAEPPAKPPADKKADKPAADDKAAKKEIISDADAERFISFFEKLVAVVVADKEDCAKMATDVNAHMDSNQGLIKEANDARNKNKDLPPAAKAKLEKLVKSEFIPALTKKCGQDKAVQAAVERMGSPRKK